MNYIEQINNFWSNHDEHLFGPTEIALYMHLLHICNKCNWTNPFKRRNTKICADLGISKPTLITNRNKLKQAGLIDFKTNGKGDENITYLIVPVDKSEYEKLKNFTSAFTSPFTSAFTSNFTHKINSKQKPKTINQPSSSRADIIDDAIADYFKQPVEEEEKSSAKKEEEVPTAKEADDFFKKHYASMYELIRKDNAGASTSDLRFALLEQFWAENIDRYKMQMQPWNEIIKHFRNWVPKYSLVKSEKERQQVNGQSNNKSRTEKSTGRTAGAAAALERLAGKLGGGVSK